MISRLSLLQLTYPKNIGRFIAYALKRHIGGQKIPGTAILELTFECPCGCSCCSAAIFQDHFKNMKMPLTVARERLLEIAALGTPRVHLTGGEPLCHENLPEIIAICRSHGLMSFLETSGFGMTLDTVQQLRSAGLSCMNVSIDSADPQTHDSLRKMPGIFETAIQTLRWCVQEKQPCLISAYATHQNIKNGDLKRMISLAKDLGCQGIRIIASQPSGKWINCRDVVLAEEELERVEEWARGPFLILNRTRPPLCPLSHGYKVVIFPDGAVGPCEHLPFLFRNSSNMPLKEVVQKMTLLPMFQPAYVCLPRDLGFMAKEGHCCSASHLTQISFHD